MRLITSDLALAEVLALSQIERATLAQLAMILEAQPSSCQRGLEILLADELVLESGEGRDRRYSLNVRNEVIGPVQQLAQASIHPRDVLRIVGRANPSMEFIGLTKDHMVVVFAKRSQAADRENATKVARELGRALGRQPQFLDHADLRRPGVNSGRIRRTVAQGEVLVGDLDRSIPDRDGRRLTAGRPLGYINPDLELPSPRTLRSIAQRFGIDAFRVFGSAVRSDFGPDSDVDIAVAPKPGRRLDRSTLDALETELEQRLDRDVDVVVDSELMPAVRYLVEKEAVAL